MSKIRDSKNIVTDQIDADGNVIVGDGNTITVINLKEAAQYKSLEADIQKLNERFEKTKDKIEKYPDESDFKTELLEIDKERSQKQKDLETLKQEVLKLAEEFSRIPINTERLRLAKQHFDKGEFKEARAVLDSGMMEGELNSLLIQKVTLQSRSSENNQQLADKANEYLILAQLTAFDFDLPTRFEKTKEYFEKALLANRSIEIIFNYGWLCCMAR